MPKCQAHETGNKVYFHKEVSDLASGIINFMSLMLKSRKSW